MKKPLLFLPALLFSSQLLAQEPPCLDQAATNAEAAQCARALIEPAEQRVAGEFKRLADKYSGNAAMQDTLKATRESWNAYRNLQCMMEGMAAAGGQSVRPLPVAANRAFLRCVARTLAEMQGALGRL